MEVALAWFFERGFPGSSFSFRACLATIAFSTAPMQKGVLCLVVAHAHNAHFLLQPVVIKNEVEVDLCFQCRGCFLDPREELALLGPLVSTEAWRETDLAIDEGHSRRKSPVSGEPMRRYRLSFGKTVEVDYCEQSGGLWLDAGEGDRLRQIIHAAAQARDSPLKEDRPQLGSLHFAFQLLSGMPLEVWNPRLSFPWLTNLLIWCCVLVFVLPLALASEQTQTFIFETFALHPDALQGHRVWGFVSYAFLHADLTHIFGNMVFLYIFGDNVEDKLGPTRFLILFVLSALAGGLAQMLTQGAGAIPTVGASGAIAGVLAAYGVLFPHVRVRMVIAFFPVYMSVLVYLAFWIIFNLGMGFAGGQGVAWWCHVGGFFMGAIIAWPQRRQAFEALMAKAMTEGRYRRR